MKAYRGIRGIAPVVLILGTSWKRLVNFTPQQLWLRERTTVAVEQDAGWALTPVWAFWRRGKSPTPTGTRNPDRAVRSLVIITTALFWFARSHGSMAIS
jgi:hypothetical protein